MQKAIIQEEPIKIIRFFDLDIYEKCDIVMMKEMFNVSFVQDEDVFFSCIREQTLTSSEELNHLRTYVPDFFAKHGKYCIISQIDDQRFHCCGWLKFNDETLNFIFEAWKYFLFMNFFSPKPSFTWNDLINKKGVFFQDTSRKSEYLLNNHLELLIIKGADGDMFEVLRQS